MPGKRKREAPGPVAPAAPPATLAALAPEDGVEEFRRAVQELKNKSQSKITALTLLADSQYAAAEEVSQILVREIALAQVQRLQPLVSVVDSILKKVGKDYKTHLSEKMPYTIQAVYSRSDESVRGWLQKIVNESWRKHDLLPAHVLDRLDLIFAPPGTAAAGLPAAAALHAAALAPMPGPPGAMPYMVPQVPLGVAPPGTVPLLVLDEAVDPRGAPPPGVSASAMAEAAALSAAAAAATRAATGQVAGAAGAAWLKPEAWPEAWSQALRGAAALAPAAAAPLGADVCHAAATAALSAAVPAVPPAVPAAEAAAPAPVPMAAPPTAVRTAAPAAPIADPRAAAVAAAVAAAAAAAAAPPEALSDEEGQPHVNGHGAPKSLVPARQVLQGLPSIGFSEAWLRQFMEQMPTKSVTQESKLEAPCVGRKVLGASGDQMVYVDELSPSETLLLAQFIFLLEERLRRSGGGIDLTQRIPHTFSYLQVEPAIDVMLKRFFGELPFQCTTTGLRFASQEKLRKHHDALYRRRTLQQQRQRGAEARGWMESIPEWVGNRDLVVGPALFRLGEAGEDAQRAQDLHMRLPAPGASDDEEGDGESRGSRWICPLDERRAVCPVSGEAFQRTWSEALNDWAFTDVVAVELGATRPLRFPPGGPIGPHGLSETAVLFKRSCFFNSAPAKRQEALDDCRRGGLPAESCKDRAACAPAAAAREDPGLVALAAARPPPRRFF